MNSLNPSQKPGIPGESDSLTSGSIDPRAEKDFNSKFYPAADGCPPPSPESHDRNDRIKLEFCAVYYQLNRLHAGLTDLRSHPGNLTDVHRERALLQQIEAHLRIRDGLEDRYAPYGIIAEATTRDGSTVDIKFTFGDRNVLCQQSAHLVSSTALLFFPERDDSVSEAVKRNRENQPADQ